LIVDLVLTGERGYASSVASVRFIVRDGKLVPLPTSPGTLFTTPALSLGAKLRLLREPFIPPTTATAEESIADFVRRRLGAEFLDYAVDPFVAGIYAGLPDEISVAAAFPRMFALEQQYGSLFKGFIRSARVTRGNGDTERKLGASFSFRNGMQTLPDALARVLPRIEYGTRVERVVRRADGAIAIEGTCAGTPIARCARSVVIAAPAYAAAKMIDGVMPETARALEAVPYAPITSTASAYRRADVAHSLAGFGFLVPKKEQRRILGSLFSSSMFADRAPEGTVLLTTFAG